MKRIFNPAIKLMNLFSYPIKFAILGVLVLSMGTYIYYSFYTNKQSSIDFSVTELKGDMYMKDLYEMISIAGKMGYADSDVKTKLITEFNSFLDDLQKVNGEQKGLSSQEKLTAITDAFEKAKTGEADKAFGLINAVNACIGEVGDKSNLILDPDIDTYYSMDSLINYMSLYIVKLAQYREDPKTYEYLLGNISDYCDTLIMERDKVYAYNPSMKGKYDATNKLKEITGKMKDLDTVSVNYNEAFDTIHTLQAVEYNGLDSLINIRVSKMVKEQRTVGLCLIVIVIVIAYIFISLYLSIKNSIKNIEEGVYRVVAGDLTVEFNLHTNDELKKIEQYLNNMLKSLRGVITQVKHLGENVASTSEEMLSSSEEVCQVSEQIASAVNDLAKGASDQATSTESGNSKVIEVVTGLSNIALEMSKSEELAEKANEVVTVGNKSVEYQNIKMKENKQVANEVSDTIGLLSQKSEEIGEIITTIQSISSQTNLLALNAAIEAARAGEQGRGFSVVAEEVRKLAEQSSTSVKEIESIIKDVQSCVKYAVMGIGKVQIAVGDQEKALSDTETTFKNISEMVAAIKNNVKKVSDISNSLSSHAKQVEGDMSDIASISEEAASSTEEVAASVEEQTAVINQIAESAGNLTTIADKLQDNIKKFTV